MSFLSELFSAGVWGRKPPSAPKWNKWVHRNLSDNHCMECLMLDGCWFSQQKAPKWPHHTTCHCILEDILWATRFGVLIITAADTHLISNLLLGERIVTSQKAHILFAVLPDIHTYPP